MDRSNAMAWVLPAVAGLLLAPPAGAATPTLQRLEPSVVVPHTAFSLVLYGAGFEAGAKVHIETGMPDRFLAYRPVELGSGSCTVRMPLGFGPKPASRQVYLENPDGGKTKPLVLQVGPERTTSAEGEGSDLPVQVDPERSGAGESSLAYEQAEAESVPVIAELFPIPVPAGRAVVLEVHGQNFTEESEVLVAVNVYAGSSRLPEYSLRAFPTLFVDAELLEVEFDRGFYPIPGARDVVVQNPDGARSAPVPMMIRAEDGP